MATCSESRGSFAPAEAMFGRRKPPTASISALLCHQLAQNDSVIRVWDMQTPAAPHTKPKETHSLLFPHLFQEERMLPTARFPQIWWIVADLGGRGGTPGQVL